MVKPPTPGKSAVERRVFRWTSRPQSALRSTSAANGLIVCGVTTWLLVILPDSDTALPDNVKNPAGLLKVRLLNDVLAVKLFVVAVCVVPTKNSESPGFGATPPTQLAGVAQARSCPPPLHVSFPARAAGMVPNMRQLVLWLRQYDDGSDRDVNQLGCSGFLGSQFMCGFEMREPGFQVSLSNFWQRSDSKYCHNPNSTAM